MTNTTHLVANDPQSSVARPKDSSRRTGWRWELPTNKPIVRGFIILGILFRLRAYLFNRSLWLDESLLAVSIVRRSPAELLKPLDYHQGAPLGFLLLEKMAVHFLGPGEMALRLIPLLCGVVSIFLFTAVARRFLAPMAVPIAVGLFCVSGPLIYYSSEVKQYSIDIAALLALYLLASFLFEVRFGIFKLTLISIIGALVLWFSQPAAFVLAGMGLTFLWISGRRNDRRALLQLCFPIAIWSCSFLLCYVVSLHGLTQDSWLMGYWQGAFAPFLPSSIADVRWFLDSFFGIFSDPVGLTFTGIAAVAAVLGVKELLADREVKFLLLVLPIGLTLLASGLHRYPFRGRLLLFMVPLLVLLIAAGLSAIRRKASETSETIPLLGTLLVGFLFLHPLADASLRLVKPRTVEETRPVIQYLEKHRLEGDILYCYYSSQVPLEYYRRLGVIGPITQITGVESREDWRSYREQLNRLRGNKRVWILISHVYGGSGVDEEQFFVDYLESMGERLDSSRARGASVYLYDLSTHGPQ